MKSKAKHKIVLGIAPRFYAGTSMLSKVISINDKLKELCETNNVRFIDTWDTLFGKRSMYQKDGTHFSKRGSQALANLINKNIHDHLEYLN